MTGWNGPRDRTGNGRGGRRPSRIVESRVGASAMPTDLEPGRIPGGETPPSTCETEVMMITGESPSRVETCDHLEPEGQLRRREAGWRAAGGESSGPKRRANGDEPDSAGRKGRACVEKAKLGARASCVEATEHVERPKTHNLNVLGVSMRARRHHEPRYETCAGARREQCRSCLLYTSRCV